MTIAWWTSAGFAWRPVFFAVHRTNTRSSTFQVPPHLGSSDSRSPDRSVFTGLRFLAGSFFSFADRSVFTGLRFWPHFLADEGGFGLVAYHVLPLPSGCTCRSSRRRPARGRCPRQPESPLFEGGVGMGMDMSVGLSVGLFPGLGPNLAAISACTRSMASAW